MGKPATKIEIIDVPLSSRQEHTFRFESFQQQQAFFDKRVRCTMEAYTYVRRSWKLNVQPPANSFPLEWKYARITNPLDKRAYFYFINRVEYVNENTVGIELELDVLQSYMFDWSLKECFVERQHTATDNIGEHTVDEGLELGEHINAHEYNVEGLQEMAIVILSSVHLSDTVTSDPDVAGGERFDNIFSGLGVYAVSLDDWLAFANLLERYSGMGAIDGIVSMYMYPKNLLVLDPSCSWESGDIVKTVLESGYDFSPLARFDNYSSKLFGGYVPKNNKLYTYPYNFLYLTNNQGGCAEYKYERFDDSTNGYLFTVYGGISPDAGVRINPAFYNGGGYEYGLTLGNYPSCAWNSDTYKVWLAQNYNTLTHSAAGSAIKVVGGAAMIAASPFTGGASLVGGAGLAYSGLSQVTGIMAQMRDMQVQPAQARGAHSATVNTNANKQTYTFYYKTLSAEYAKQVDEFFTMYGYKLNRVAKPDIWAHRAYTYVKTVGCIVGGTISAEDSAAIAAIFDRGVTFWSVYPLVDGNGNVERYLEYMGNYDLNPT